MATHRQWNLRRRMDDTLGITDSFSRRTIFHTNFSPRQGAGNRVTCRILDSNQVVSEVEIPCSEGEDAVYFRMLDTTPPVETLPSLKEFGSESVVSEGFDERWHPVSYLRKGFWTKTHFYAFGIAGCTFVWKLESKKCHTDVWKLWDCGESANGKHSSVPMPGSFRQELATYSPGHETRRTMSTSTPRLGHLSWPVELDYETKLAAMAVLIAAVEQRRLKTL